MRFTNRDKRFQEDSVAYRDRGNFQITQVVLSQSLIRLWITRQAVAQKIASALNPSIDKTTLEVLTVGGVLKGMFEFSGGTGPRTITNAQLVAALGSEADFKLRAWFVRSGLRSINYDEVTVRKL